MSAGAMTRRTNEIHNALVSVMSTAHYTGCHGLSDVLLRHLRSHDQASNEEDEALVSDTESSVVDELADSKTATQCLFTRKG